MIITIVTGGYLSASNAIGVAAMRVIIEGRLPDLTPAVVDEALRMQSGRTGEHSPTPTASFRGRRSSPGLRPTARTTAWAPSSLAPRSAQPCRRCHVTFPAYGRPSRSRAWNGPPTASTSARAPYASPGRPRDRSLNTKR